MRRQGLVWAIDWLAEHIHFLSLPVSVDRLNNCRWPLYLVRPGDPLSLSSRNKRTNPKTGKRVHAGLEIFCNKVVNTLRGGIPNCCIILSHDERTPNRAPSSKLVVDFMADCRTWFRNPILPALGFCT